MTTYETVELVGGPFDGKKIQVVPSCSCIEAPSNQSIVHIYARRIGTKIFVHISIKSGKVKPK